MFDPPEAPQLKQLYHSVHQSRREEARVFGVVIRNGLVVRQ